MKTTLIPVQVPDWAKWVAQDQYGSWFAHECEPPHNQDLERWVSGGLVQFLFDGGFNPNWRETLREVA